MKVNKRILKPSQDAGRLANLGGLHNIAYIFYHDSHEMWAAVSKSAGAEVVFQLCDVGRRVMHK